MRLLDTLIEEFRDYVLLDRAVPVDLMVRMEEAGLDIDGLRHSLLIEHMYESI